MASCCRAARHLTVQSCSEKSPVPLQMALPSNFTVGCRAHLTSVTLGFWDAAYSSPPENAAQPTLKGLKTISTAHQVAQGHDEDS